MTYLIVLYQSIFSLTVVLVIYCMASDSRNDIVAVVLLFSPESNFSLYLPVVSVIVGKWEQSTTSLPLLFYFFVS